MSRPLRVIATVVGLCALAAVILRQGGRSDVALHVPAAEVARVSAVVEVIDSAEAINPAGADEYATWYAAVAPIARSVSGDVEAVVQAMLSIGYVRAGAGQNGRVYLFKPNDATLDATVLPLDVFASGEVHDAEGLVGRRFGSRAVRARASTVILITPSD